MASARKHVGLRAVDKQIGLQQELHSCGRRPVTQSPLCAYFHKHIASTQVLIRQVVEDMPGRRAPCGPLLVGPHVGLTAAVPPAPQQMQRATADPLEALPVALVANIFAHLDTRSLLQAGQVMADMPSAKEAATVTLIHHLLDDEFDVWVRCPHAMSKICCVCADVGADNGVSIWAGVAQLAASGG